MVGLADLDARSDRTRADAEAATAQRDTDDRLRERDEAVLVAADDAGKQLRARLRQRIEAAVARGALPPVWFEKPLGLAPAGDPERWLEVAVAVVAHRILYGVDSQVSALGPPPGADCPPHRRDAHGLLQAELRTVR